MAIFNSYVSHYQRVWTRDVRIHRIHRIFLRLFSDQELLRSSLIQELLPGDVEILTTIATNGRWKEAARIPPPLGTLCFTTWNTECQKKTHPQNWQSQKKTWQSTMGVWATRSLGRTIFTSLIIDNCAQWSLNTEEAGWSAKEPTFVYWIDGLEYHTGTFNQEDQTKDQVGGTFSQPFWCLPVD